MERGDSWLPDARDPILRVVSGLPDSAILRRGFGGGPIPMNTLDAVPDRRSRSAADGGMMAVGTDDLVYIGGWLDVTGEPRRLEVPAMDGRYYSFQLTDPTSGANFAYIGKRTTGTDVGEFLLCAPGWSGSMPTADDEDRRAAYALAKQIRLTPPREYGRVATTANAAQCAQMPGGSPSGCAVAGCHVQSYKALIASSVPRTPT